MLRIYLMWYACLTTFWRQSTHLEGAWKERKKLSVFNFQSLSFHIEASTTHVVESRIPVSGLYLPYLIFHWIWSVHRGQQLTTWVFLLGGKETVNDLEKLHTCVFFITAILPSLWYLSVFHATVFCMINKSQFNLMLTIDVTVVSLRTKLLRLLLPDVSVLA